MWGEALIYASFIVRHVPSSGNPYNEAPIQRLERTRSPVDISSFRTFFAPVYYIERPPKTGRFKQQGHRGHFLGFIGSNMKAYRIMTEDKRMINKAERDTYFMEDGSYQDIIEATDTNDDVESDLTGLNETPPKIKVCAITYRLNNNWCESHF